MKDSTVRVTKRLPDGREIEAEAEARGGLVRLRARLCRDGLVTSAIKMTAPIAQLLERRELLPREFTNDPAIAEATLQQTDEMWRHRLRLLCPPPGRS
jgi:hypothetical protein